MFEEGYVICISTDYNITANKGGYVEFNPIPFFLALCKPFNLKCSRFGIPNIHGTDPDTL